MERVLRTGWDRASRGWRGRQTPAPGLGAGHAASGVVRWLGRGGWEALRCSVSCLGTPAPNPGFQTRSWSSHFVFFFNPTFLLWKLRNLKERADFYVNYPYSTVNTWPYLLYHIFPPFYIYTHFFSLSALVHFRNTLAHVKGEYMFTVILWQNYHMVTRMNLQVGWVSQVLIRL